MCRKKYFRHYYQDCAQLIDRITSDLLRIVARDGCMCTMFTQVFTIFWLLLVLIKVSEGNSSSRRHCLKLQSISGQIILKQETENLSNFRRNTLDSEKEKEDLSNVGRNYVNSAVLLSDLLIKLKKENDLEKNKSESKPKLERKREVVNQKIKLEKPNFENEKPSKHRKSVGDLHYRDSAKSASLLSDLLIKLKKDNAAGKVERKTNQKELNPPPSSLLTAILGLYCPFSFFRCDSIS